MEYIVWVGGSEIGVYERKSDAEEVAKEWLADGYDDVIVQTFYKD